MHHVRGKPRSLQRIYQFMETSHDFCCTSTRKIRSSNRAIEHCITAEQYTFIFQIITAASFGMSRCMDHLNGKSRQSDNIQILQKYIRHNRTSLSIMYSHIDRRFAEHLLFLTTGINRNIIFLLYCLCSQNVIKMSMGKKNCHRFSIHPGNLHFNLLRTICGINNDQFSGFFILKEIAICIYRS